MAENRSIMSRPARWILLLLLALAGVALWRGARGERALTLEGRTMGTTYHVTLRGREAPRAEVLQEAIDGRLRAISRSMSTWDPASEISRVNARPAGEPIPISPSFRTVLEAALRVGERTGGAFDVTVGPLVNLWGYGPAPHDHAPSRAEIEAARRRIGIRHLSLRGATLVKGLPGMELDFSGIAKGYGVDEVARILRERGIENYLVEIGGEVVVRGTSPRGAPWSVGIERPDEGAPRGAAFLGRLRLTEGAIATSGSYRRFRREGGRKSNHIIDPRTGEPTRSSLVSVTVYAPDCMTADAIATALMVMGLKEGLAWVERTEGVEALLIEAAAEGGYALHPSSGFARLMD
jgi:thiamine biosynthesis lipoprotein